MKKLLLRIKNKIIRERDRLIRLLFPGPLGASVYKWFRKNQQQFTCPICDFHGPFYGDGKRTGRHEHCPKCGANERSRLQYLVLNVLRKSHDFSTMSALHFAPETVFRAYFKKLFMKYDTADLEPANVDYQADLLALPFKDGSYDFVYASHVLEHVGNDEKAIAEIRRILKPGGIAILPLPIVAEKTIEYGADNPLEDGHVRAPGPDYFERYERHFSTIKVYRSDDFPEVYQLYNYEDRSNWPTAERPLSKPMAGERHLDYVPVCFV